MTPTETRMPSYLAGYVESGQWKLWAALASQCGPPSPQILSLARSTFYLVDHQRRRTRLSQ